MFNDDLVLGIKLFEIVFEGGSCCVYGLCLMIRVLLKYYFR